MKSSLIASVLLAASALMSTAASAQATVGQPAPAIAATDVTGSAVALADYRGKVVVVEWTNPQCPFVRKHYDSGNMPATQRKALEQGVVWLTVQTTAPKAGEPAPATTLAAWLHDKGAAPTAAIIDADGAIARAYGARATPHMFVVDPQGVLVYAGAIDSKPSANPADIAGATNYVTQALDEVVAGKPVSRPTTQAYGCAVKYPDAAS